VIQPIYLGYLHHTSLHCITGLALFSPTLPAFLFTALFPPQAAANKPTTLTGIKITIK
jgi:hypothetical protein